MDMVEKDLAEKCRKDVEEYCSVNQITQTNNSVVSSHQYNRANEIRAHHTFRNILIGGFFVASAFIGYYVLNYNRSYPASLTQISSETPVQKSNQNLYRPSWGVQRTECIAEQSNQNHYNPQRRDTTKKTTSTGKIPQTDCGRLRKERLDYFNREKQKVIRLVREGSNEEAGNLTLRLKQEIQEARKQGAY